jgi:hypothetical protein
MAREPKSRAQKNNSERIPKSPIAFGRWLKKEKDQLKRKTLLIGFVFDRLAKQGVDCYLVGGSRGTIYFGPVRNG